MSSYRKQIMKLEELRKHFLVPGIAFDDESGLTRVSVKSSESSGELFLNGAHCAAWQPAGQAAVLWMSQRSYYESNKPIRGGVPICFPWFGPHASDKSLPAHGSARLKEWELSDIQSDADGTVRVTCCTHIEPFDLEYVVSFGAKLKMSLTTRLPVEHRQAESFEDALHTYLSISDIRKVTITGLENCAYVDKMDGAAIKPGAKSAIEFTQETDRIYFDSIEPCVLHDAGWSRRIIVSKSGSRSTIVWNPWIDKAARMPDFGDDEWPGMVCIETANVGVNAIHVQPGEEHTTVAELEVE